MAHFLKGKYKGFYHVSTSPCVRDVFRFKHVGEGKIYMESTRRDMESYMKRFWKYENATISLMPIDESQPRLGGKVKVSGFAFDFRTMTPAMQT